MMKRTGTVILGTLLIAAFSFSGCSNTTGSESSASSASEGTTYVQSKFVCTSYCDWVESSIATYDYDEAGLLNKTFYFDKDDKLTGWDTNYNYDDNGNELVHIQYDTEGNPLNFTSREYDDEGRVTKYSQYDKNGEIIQSTEYQYTCDDKGNLIKMSCIDSDGKLAQEVEYDENGKKSKDIYYWAENSTAYYDYKNEYDANGNNIKTSIYVRYYSADEEPSLESHNEMKYDEHGNMISLDHYDATGKLEFHYDIEYIAV
ncbi:MAG: hypothetical protein K5665_12105 [Saccharofermentans sp.]|nr:hypothetical protein [Saccharofermentans sp.]